MMGVTGQKRTTRIRGQIALGEWSRVIGKRYTSGSRKGKLIEMTEQNCQFDEAIHEDDILIDTGCSYTIVSQDWLETYCKQNRLDIGSVLIEYPENYQSPAANTAAEGSTVRGIGFARIKLKIVTLPTGSELKWSEDAMNSGAGASVMEINTYAHVFEGMASPWLLGMPFIQEFTSGWNMETQQVTLKNNQGIRGSVPLHPAEEVPMRPVMVCTTQDIHLEGGNREMDVQGYTVGIAFQLDSNLRMSEGMGNGQE